MKSVLMIGQSNMAGRGDLLCVRPIASPRIFMLRGEEFVPMREPIHDDKPTLAGACLGASFAQAYTETYGEPLGLIPAAFGGTHMYEWERGTAFYDRAVRMARAAQKEGEIVAFLWHQGEGDQNNPDYTEQLTACFENLAQDLDLSLSRLVILVGELGRFRPCDPAPFNRNLHRLEAHFPRYAVVSSEGLEAQDATTHFDAPALRVFGYRYFEAYRRLAGGTPYPYAEDPAEYRIQPAAADVAEQEGVTLIRFGNLPADARFPGRCSLGRLTSVAPTRPATVACRGVRGEAVLAYPAAPAGEQPYLDLATDTEGDFSVEADFLRSEPFTAGAELLKLCPATGSFPLLWVGADGKLYRMREGKAAERCDAWISEHEWSRVRVDFHRARGCADLYLNMLPVAMGVPLTEGRRPPSRGCACCSTSGRGRGRFLWTASV